MHKQTIKFKTLTTNQTLELKALYPLVQIVILEQETKMKTPGSFFGLVTCGESFQRLE